MDSRSVIRNERDHKVSGICEPGPWRQDLGLTFVISQQIFDREHAPGNKGAGNWEQG